MNTKELSTCFCTTEVESCREFYIKYFAAKAVFDCGWYAVVKISKKIS